MTHPARIGQSYCRACHAAYVREHRPRYRDMKPEQKKIAIFRSKANVYQQRGLIKKKPCEVCKGPAQKRYLNYNDLGAVRWLCTRHRNIPTKGTRNGGHFCTT
jgi:hypothetical protein